MLELKGLKGGLRFCFVDNFIILSFPCRWDYPPLKNRKSKMSSKSELISYIYTTVEAC